MRLQPHLQVRTVRLCLLLLLTLIAGCAQETPPIEHGKTTDGITILSFAPEKDILREKETTNMILRIQNTGDFLASKIKTKLTRTGELKTEAITPTIEDLDPPDESFNQPGGIKEIMWTLTAPETEMPKEQDITARIEFNYQSETTKEIPILSSTRAREMYQAGKQPEPGMETSSSAPLRLQILAKDPIALGEGETEGEFTFKVYATNDGSGVVETDKSAPQNCMSEKLDCIDSLEISANAQELTCEVE